MGDEVWVRLDEGKCGIDLLDYKVVIDIVPPERCQYHGEVNGHPYIQLDCSHRILIKANLPKDRASEEQLIRNALLEEIRNRRGMGFI